MQLSGNTWPVKQRGTECFEHSARHCEQNVRIGNVSVHFTTLSELGERNKNCMIDGFWN